MANETAARDKTEANLMDTSTFTTTTRPTTIPPPSEANVSLLITLVIAIVILGILIYLLDKYRRRRRKRRSRNPEDEEVQQHVTPSSAYQMIPEKSSKNESKNSKKQSPKDAILDHPAFTSLWLSGEGMITTQVRGSENAHTGTLDNGTRVFLKSVRLTSPRLPRFIDAIDHVSRLDHSSINGIHGVMLWHFDGSLCAAAKYMTKGSLGPLIRDTTKPIPPSQRQSMCISIAHGLAYLHQRNQPYGHLHSGNILVDSTLECKLNGFALLKNAPNDSPSIESYGRFFTPYLAPEYLAQSTSPTIQGDVYAFGILCGEIITRTQPHGAIYHANGYVNGDLYLVQRARDGKKLPFPFDQQLLTSIGTMEIIEIISNCLHHDPNQRPSMIQVATALQAISSLEE